MKQLRYTLLIMLVALVLLPTGVGAAETQKDLKIQDVFTRYGKKKNVTMVELSNEMLETYGMTRYKSITIKNDPEALRFTRQCLETDQRGARKIKEVTDDGGVVSAYYQLPGKESDVNRFVLFKVNSKGTITLVYIEGELDSDDLITLLFTKKIYKLINKKRDEKIFTNHSRMLSCYRIAGCRCRTDVDRYGYSVGKQTYRSEGQQ